MLTMWQNLVTFLYFLIFRTGVRIRDCWLIDEKEEIKCYIWCDNHKHCVYPSQIHLHPFLLVVFLSSYHISSFYRFIFYLICYSLVFRVVYLATILKSAGTGITSFCFVFWIMASCSLVWDAYVQHFEGSYCLLLQVADPSKCY